MYPGMCDLIEKFSELCNAREKVVEKSPRNGGNSSEIDVHSESAKITEGGMNITEQWKTRTECFFFYSIFLNNILGLYTHKFIILTRT